MCAGLDVSVYRPLDVFSQFVVQRSELQCVYSLRDSTLMLLAGDAFNGALVVCTFIAALCSLNISEVELEIIAHDW